MLKILIEMKFYVGPQGRSVVSCRCKAPSCLVSFNGDLEAIVKRVAEHLSWHGSEFVSRRAWIRDGGARLAPTSFQEE